MLLSKWMPTISAFRLMTGLDLPLPLVCRAAGLEYSI